MRRLPPPRVAAEAAEAARANLAFASAFCSEANLALMEAPDAELAATAAPLAEMAALATCVLAEFAAARAFLA